MPRLTKIYTRGGDTGETSFGDGTRAPKNNIRTAAGGDVDELNALVGMLCANVGDDEDANAITLRAIQHDLFDLGAAICLPGEAGAGRIAAARVEWLEEAIDALNAALDPLANFILPGGTIAASWANLARTVARRAERSVITLNRESPLEPVVMQYLNRLSDYFFVLGRTLNNAGADDIFWQPSQA